MATVYRVRHEQLDTLYALKVLGLDGTNVRERLLREGRVQASLRHPNIVEVRDVLDVNGAPGLLMEFIDGVAMDQWLEKHQPNAEEALTLFRGILAGVGHAHAQGFIHRDLKPANVMMQITDNELVPKITDFGLAKLIESPNDHRKTRTGSTMGTPAYMPPEQFSDASSVDRRADLYALGCILYELFCGRKPFDEPKLLDMFAKIRVGQYPPPREINPDIPEEVAVAIEQLVTVEPEERLTDCAAILSVLDGGSEAPSGKTLERARPTKVTGNTSLQLTSPGGIIAAELAVAHRAATEAAVERVEGPPPATEETMLDYSEPGSAADTVAAETIATDIQPASTTEVAAAPRSRAPLYAVIALALVALIVLAIAVPASIFGASFLFGTDTSTRPAPTAPLPQPDPTPVPPPTPEPVEPAPEAPEPVPTQPEPTQPEPAQPAPVASPTPTPSPTPPPAPSTPETGLFEATGARSAMLISDTGKTYRAGQAVPPGSYTIMATFDGAPKPTPAGKATIEAAKTTALTCKAKYQRCSARVQ